MNHDDILHHPDFDAQSPAATFLTLMRSNEREAAERGLALVAQAHLFRWDAVATSQGRPFYDAVFLQGMSNHRWPSLYVLNTINTWSEGQAWSAVDDHHEVAFERWIRASNVIRHMDDKDDRALAWLIAQTSSDVLHRWQTAKLDDPEKKIAFDPTEHEGLLPYLIRRKCWHAVLATMNRGFSLLNTDPHHAEPVAMLINHEDLWAAYLKEGGDPRQVILRQSTSTPLWEFLWDRDVNEYEHTRQALWKTVNQWAMENEPTGVDRLNRTMYWRDLNASQATDQTMKRDPNWPTLQDEQGRTPMMALLTHGGKYLRAFSEVKKAWPYMRVLDHQGRSLWPYALSSPGGLPGQGLDWLINRVPLNTDKDGDGLVAQCYLLSPHADNVDLKVLHWPNSLTQPSPENTTLWWGDAHAQERLATWMLNRDHGADQAPSRKKSFEQIAMVSYLTTDASLSPRLLGALVCNELMHRASDSSVMQARSIDHVHQWLEWGARCELDEHMRNNLLRLNPEASMRAYVEKTWAALEVNALKTAWIDPLETTSPGARPRL